LIKYSLPTGGRFTLTPALEVIGCEYPDKLYLFRNYCTCGMIVLFIPDAGNRTIVSSLVWTKHRNVADRQTDRRNLSGYYSALHCEQCGRTVKKQNAECKCINNKEYVEQ